MDPSNAQYGDAVSWWSYVEQHKGDADQAEIATWAGVNASTVSRWKTGKQAARPEAAVAFARARKRPVLEALVAAGFLTEKEARVRPAGTPDLSQLTNDELLELVRARMGERGEHGGDTAATKAPGSGPDNVRSLSKREQMREIQSEAARPDEE